MIATSLYSRPLKCLVLCVQYQRTLLDSQRLQAQSMATARIINIQKAHKIFFIFYIYPSVCKLELSHLHPPVTYSLLCVKTFFKNLADWQLWKFKQIPVHICIFSSVARRWDGIGQPRSQSWCPRSEAAICKDSLTRSSPTDPWCNSVKHLST